MKKALLLLATVAIQLHAGYTPISAQELPSGMPKAELRYANSAALTVYEKPDITSAVIGQLITNESILVVVGGGMQEGAIRWIRIVSPYEGYFQQTQKPADLSKTAVVPKISPGNQFVPEPSVPGEETELESSAAGETLQKTGGDSGRKKRFNLISKARKSILIGLGAGVYTVVEEEGYSPSGSPLDLYLEFLEQDSFLSRFRFGFNTIGSKDSDYEVSTSSIYMAYRLTLDQIELWDFDFFGVAGVAWMMSSITGNASGDSAGLGLMAGGGGYYSLFSSLKLGAQMVYFTHQQNFGGIKRYVGSTQVQVSVNVLF